MPTREYEGMREGFNDVRYLEMLNNRVQALASHQDKLDATAKAAWKEAEQIVNHAPTQFQGPTVSAVSDRIDGKALARLPGAGRRSSRQARRRRQSPGGHAVIFAPRFHSKRKRRMIPSPT